MLTVALGLGSALDCALHDFLMVKVVRAAAIWTALIVASTVLVKQHYLADLAGGLALAAVTSLFVMPATRAA